MLRLTFNRICHVGHRHNCNNNINKSSIRLLKRNYNNNNNYMNNINNHQRSFIHTTSSTSKSASSSIEPSTDGMAKKIKKKKKGKKKKRDKAEEEFRKGKVPAPDSTSLFRLTNPELFLDVNKKSTWRIVYTVWFFCLTGLAYKFYEEKVLDRQKPPDMLGPAKEDGKWK